MADIGLLNIQSGMKMAGIWLMNTHKIQEDPITYQLRIDISDHSSCHKTQKAQKQQRTTQACRITRTAFSATMYCTMQCNASSCNTPSSDSSVVFCHIM